MNAVLVDVSLCTGCSECIAACCARNGFEFAPQRSLAENPDGLSAVRYATLLKVSTESGETRFVRKSCQHCLDPACVSVCPVGAMQRSPSGAVIYDAGLCMGCRYCMMACPYGVPRYEWQSGAPKVRKCDLCYARIIEGESPACVDACPQGALSFGRREALIRQAHLKILAEPGKYLPKVYGEHEAGGANLLYISDTPLDLLGMNGDPGAGDRPALSQAWLGKVPGISLATAGLMTGLFYVIGRRMQAEESHARMEGEA